MTFRDPILGGDELVRTAMQSSNYVAGSSGWRIARDGTVEFYAGTFRGSLSAGSNPGQHFIVSNAATGDVVDVYDSANHLIFAITNQGLAASYTTGTAPQPSVGFQNAQLQFSDNSTPTAHQATMSWTAPAVAAAQGVVTLLNSGYVSDVGALEVLCGSADGSKRPTVQAIERGHQGSVVVSDQTSTGNLVHTFSGSGTTDGSGHLVIATGAAFAATDGHVMYDQTSRSGGIWCSACWYDVASGSIGTQWMTTAGAAASTTVFYRGKIYG
jgi:hypothetical protein